MPRTPGEILRYMEDAAGQTIREVHNDGDMVAFIFTDDSVLVLGAEGEDAWDDDNTYSVVEIEPARVQKLSPIEKLRLGLITKAQAEYLKKEHDEKRAEEKRASELKQLADLKAKYEAAQG